MRIKIRKSDELYSKYIRTKAKWTCERCGAYYSPPTKALHASHYWGRGRENTRFDEKNVFSICHGCHSYFHANPFEHTEWIKKKIGEEEFVHLKIRAHVYKKRDDKADVMIIKNLLTTLKEK